MALRRVFIDVESTGDGSDHKHDILDIYCELYMDNVPVSTFKGTYCGTDATVYQASTMNKDKGQRRARSGNYETPDEGFVEFVAWLENWIENKDNRALLIGYNCQHDLKLIKNWFIRNNRRDRKYFYDPCICVMQMMMTRTGKWLSLEKTAEAMGVKITNRQSLHTAEFDTKLCRHLYFKLEALLKA